MVYRATAVLLTSDAHNNKRSALAFKGISSEHKPPLFSDGINYSIANSPDALSATKATMKLQNQSNMNMVFFSWDRIQANKVSESLSGGVQNL